MELAELIRQYTDAHLKGIYIELLLSGKMTIFAHGYILISQKQR